MFVRIIKFARQERFILIVMAATVVAFSIVSLFSYQVTHWFEVRFFDSAVGQIQRGLDADSRYVFQQAGEIATSSSLAKLIETRDISHLASTLQSEQTIHRLDTIIVTDDRGIVLSQTPASSRSGDYIFQATSYGRRVAEGKPVISIERGSSVSLLVIAGYPVIDNGRTIGAVFGGYSVDDAYAGAFKSRYLTDGENLIFYSKQDGVVGTTFGDPNTKLLLAAYFNTGSDWVQKGQSDREAIVEGRAYFIKNLVFHGLYESPGGMLILYPAGYTVQAAIFSSIVALIFVLIVFFFHTRGATKKRHAIERIILIICSSIVLVAAFSVDSSLLYNHSLSIRRPPYTIYNSTLTLDPSFAAWSRSSEQQVAIDVLTGGEAINVAQVDLTYDSARIRVVDIITADSFCAPTMFLEKSIDNKRGEVRVTCGLLTPGFSGLNGNVFTLVLQPLKEGEVTLHFSTSTRILANDELGTDVLRLATDGSYRIVDKSTIYNSTSSIPVFSPTYPNSARWYNEPDGLFTWITSNGYHYLYSLDNIPTASSLVGASTTSADSVSFSGLTDGIYYFHIAPVKNGTSGAVSNYKVMIDTTPPLQPVIKASKTAVSEGEVIRLAFESQDNSSGLQGNYYVRFDDGVFLPAASPLSVSLPIGTHVITVRAFDRAGNFADGNIKIGVTKR
ncbi:MAG: hypothetical protein ABSF56_00345 [Minisyncoccia bacterium]|jgi:hypothetical protein